MEKCHSCRPCPCWPHVPADTGPRPIGHCKLRCRVDNSHRCRPCPCPRLAPADTGPRPIGHCKLRCRVDNSHRCWPCPCLPLFPRGIATYQIVPPERQHREQSHLCRLVYPPQLHSQLNTVLFLSLLFRKQPSKGFVP